MWYILENFSIDDYPFDIKSAFVVVNLSTNVYVNMYYLMCSVNIAFFKCSLKYF